MRDRRFSSLAFASLALLVILTPAPVGRAQVQAGARAGLASAAAALVAETFKPDAPGGTVIVVKDGKPLYRGARGLANLEAAIPLGPEMALRIGSVTKQFTSAVILMLVEQGKVGLQDDITKYLPDYPTRGKRITVEHLLTHTSGIKSYTSLPSWQPLWSKDFTTAEMIDLFKNEPMDFDPGERYLYNNSAYFLLGAVIEKVSGLPYGEVVRRTIFAPLGMNASRYGDVGPEVKDRVLGYAQDGARYVLAPHLSMTQPGAAGALVSSVDDLARWDAAVSAGKLLTASSWARIFTPFTLNNGNSTGYGFGWQVGRFDGRPVVEHGGGIHGFSAYALRLPEHEVYVAVLSNNSNTNAQALARKLAALAAGKPLVDPPAIPVTSEELSAYAGVYQADEVKVTITAGDGLRLQAGGTTSTLVPMARDRFFVRGSFNRYAFTRDGSGKVVGFTRSTFNGEDTGRRTDDPLPKSRREIALDPKVFDAYVGEYQLAPGFLLTVWRDGPRFLTRATGQGEVEIFAESETEFFLKVVDAQLSFAKDASGKVTGVVLHQNGRDVPGAKVK